MCAYTQAICTNSPLWDKRLFWQVSSHVCLWVPVDICIQAYIAWAFSQEPVSGCFLIFVFWVQMNTYTCSAAPPLQDKQPPRLPEVPLLVGLGDGSVCTGRYPLLPTLDVQHQGCFQEGISCNIKCACRVTVKYSMLLMCCCSLLQLSPYLGLHMMFATAYSGRV